MRHWLLPEAIEDLLPDEACQVELLRRRLLDDFDRHGYQLVVPPMLEYVDSLLTGTGRDLDLRTFKLVDQLSGRTLGIRADIAPQVARIDAHLLNRHGVARLCYCGSVLHALPADFLALREPIQIGAELYGHEGSEADGEIVRLLIRALNLSELTTTRIDLGHIGIFRSLTSGLSSGLAEELFAALQAKDAAAMVELTRTVPEPVRSALLVLPDCYGDSAKVFGLARRKLPDTPEIRNALNTLQQIMIDLTGLPVGLDLADLRSYHYHTGIVFAAYCNHAPGAVALGGRYDQVGKIFGRPRFATGFSMDLRRIAQLSAPRAPGGAVLAPWPETEEMRQEIERLRGNGEKVMLALPGHQGAWREAGCDRCLVLRAGQWVVEPLKE